MTLQAQIMCQNCTHVVYQLDSSRRGMRGYRRGGNVSKRVLGGWKSSHQMLLYIPVNQGNVIVIHKLILHSEPIAPNKPMNCDPLNYELQNLREELHKAKKELAACKFGFGLVEGDDKKTHYYTGLASWALFLHVFNFLSSHVKHSCRVMTPMDQFFLVLVKLRLDLHFQDMAYRFAVSLGTITNIFHEWLEIMSMRLKFLIMWPSREILSENMPQVFKDLYPRARCIIDCSEVFTE